MNIDDYNWAVANATNSAEVDRLSNAAIADMDVPGGREHYIFQYMCRVIGKTLVCIDATQTVEAMMKAACDD